MISKEERVNVLSFNKLIDIRQDVLSAFRVQKLTDPQKRLFTLGE